MTRIGRLFERLKLDGRKGLIAYITAGDPEPGRTPALAQALVRGGADLIELGVPFSDPIADGPVIQASYTRALNKKIKLAGILKTLEKLTPELSIPIVTMVSYAIVYRHGLEKYVSDAKTAGVAGAIVPDLPVEEAGPLADICRREDFSLIQLITPTTPRDRALKIARKTTGFIYYVSVTGITGERAALPRSILDNVAWLRSQTPLPICIGFGISRPEHVRMLSPVADGLIVGSAIVRRMADADKRPRQEVLKEIGDYAAELIAAMQ